MARLIASLFLFLSITASEGRSSRRFPADFKFGASTAAYQVEGAWDEGGKSWSVWDHLVRTDPGHIADRSNADVAANSYHLYKRDVQMLRELGANIYRFSISWPRILPTGKPDYVNPRAVAYYNNLIDELLANGIEPFPTIYHWDLPHTLHEQGGLLSDDFPEWFGDYARVLYQNFGDRIKHWLTINEPYIHCYMAYGIGFHAPRIKSPGVGFYDCGRNILLANARAYRIYHDEGFKATQNGELGIVMSMEWAIPSTDSDDDAEAVADHFAFIFGQYADPIFTTQGNYPQRMIDRVAAASVTQGLNASRLRPFTEDQINYIRGTADFLGLNHYTSDIVYRNSSIASLYEVPSFLNDAYFGTYKDPTWPTSASPWLTEYAPGFYDLLIHIKNHYNVSMYITENGISSARGLVDDARIRYFRNYLNALSQAMEEGVDVKGYFAWSLMDNFEWAEGFTQCFGLYEVDMTDPNRTRTPRKSALVYKEIIRSRVIDFTYNPDPYAVTDSSYSTTASVLTVIFVGLFVLI